MTQTLLAIVFLCTGIAIGIYGYGVLGDSKASGSWPSVEGTVVTSEVEQSRDTTSKSRNKYKYSPNIVFEYEVGDYVYSSDRVEFVTTTSKSPNDIREITARYPVGSGVAVFYDPADPGNSVLTPGVSWKSYIFLAMGAIFALVGVVALFVRR
jgi:hypothetical protein